MKSEVTTYRYQSFEDDIVESADQQHQLPDGYEWVDDRRSARFASAALGPLAAGLARIYLAVALGWRVDDRTIEHPARGTGYMLFCNHTQPVGDALAPTALACPRRAYVLASPANLGIPVLGKLLPTLGALPVPSTLAGLKRFRAAIARRLRDGACVAVYPEAHVWPWCTFVRPFPASAFAFAVENRAPVYCATTTYHPRSAHRKPRAVAILDGPFWPDDTLPKKRAKEKLRDEVHARMVERSAENEVVYARYERAGDPPARPAIA